jgi:hypothetical protein
VHREGVGVEKIMGEDISWERKRGQKYQDILPYFLDPF